MRRRCLLPRALLLSTLTAALLVTGCGRSKKKKAAPVDAGVVVEVMIDADVIADAGVVGAVVDAGVNVDAGVTVDAGAMAAMASVVDAGVVDDDVCRDDRARMQALAADAARDPVAAHASSRSLWGTGVCRMDPALRHARAHILRALASTTTDPMPKKELLQESAELRPDPATLVALGDACDAVNDGPCAIAAWQEAVALSPERSRPLAAKIERLQKKLAVEQAFDSRQTQHFIARYEGEERRELADVALAILEEARTTLERRLGVVPPTPITVVLYTGDQYTRSSSGPDWSGAIYDGKIRIKESQLKAERGTLQDTLFHEYLHALLRTTIASPVPTWFNEGLAQWAEPDGDKDDIAARMKARSPDTLPALARLSRGFGGDKKTVQLQYDCAFDLIDELEDWRGAQSFAAMFTAMRDGRPFASAFDDVYGMDLSVFESRWRSRAR